VLIGHSKGGVDAAAALQLYPELHGRVRANLMMQAPYGGTPLAEDIASCPELRPHVDGFIKRCFSGDPSALADLSYARRRPFIEQHPYPADVPTICLATSSSHPLSITAAAAHYVAERYGEKADGLVAQKDAAVPGARLVEVAGLDHAAAAMKTPSFVNAHGPRAITLALVALSFAV